MLVICVIGTCKGGPLLGWVGGIKIFSGEVNALEMVGEHPTDCG